MYGAKDPTETTGDISVQICIMWNPFLKHKWQKEIITSSKEKRIMIIRMKSVRAERKTLGN